MSHVFRSPFNKNIVTEYEEKPIQPKKERREGEYVYLYSYGDVKRIASFKISSFIKLPSFKNITEKKNYNNEYAESIDDIFNIVYSSYFKKDIVNFTQKMKFLLLIDIIFDPYVSLRIMNQHYGSEPNFEDSYSDNGLKITLAYLYTFDITKHVNTENKTTFSSIIKKISERHFQSFNLLDEDQNITFGTKKKQLRSWKSDFDKKTDISFENSNFTNNPKFISSDIVKSDYFENSYKEFKVLFNAIISGDTFPNVSEIVKNVENKYDWMYSDTNSHKSMQKRIIGDVLISNTYKFDKYVKYAYPSTDIHSLNSRYESCIINMSTKLKLSETKYYLNYISTWKRAEMHLELTKLEAFASDSLSKNTITKKAMDGFNSVMQLKILIMLAPYNYVGIIYDFMKSIDDIVSETIQNKCELCKFFVSNLLRLGVTNTQLYYNFTYNVYITLLSINKIIGAWAFEYLIGNKMSSKIKNIMIDQDKTPKLANGIYYVPIDDIDIPIMLALESSEPLNTFKQSIDKFPKFKNHLTTQINKRHQLFNMVNTSDNYVAAGTYINQFYNDLQWIALHLDSISKEIRAYIKNNYSKIKPTNSNIIYDILSVHLLEKNGKTTVMEFPKIITMILETTKNIKRMNKIIPNYPITEQFKQLHSSNSASLEAIFSVMIENGEILKNKQSRRYDEIFSDYSKKLTSKFIAIKRAMPNVFDKNELINKYTSDDIEFTKFIKVLLIMEYSFINVDNKFKHVMEISKKLFKLLNIIIGTDQIKSQFFSLETKIKEGLESVKPYLENVLVVPYYDISESNPSQKLTSMKEIDDYIPFLPYVFGNK